MQWERKAVDDALGVVALRFAREPDTMHSLDRRMKKKPPCSGSIRLHQGVTPVTPTAHGDRIDICGLAVPSLFGCKVYA